VGFHAVVGFASNDLPGGWRLLRRLFAFGHEAVAVFIVLSGYCLMLPVVKSSPDELRTALGRFIRRRALRILPPYYAALAGSLALMALVPALRERSGTIWDDSLPGLDAGAILSHVLVVHNWSKHWGYQINGPLWSVASEWQIYFFFPLVLLPLWRRFGMAAALLAAAVIGYCPLLFARSGASVAIPWYLLLFAFGMAAAAIGIAPQASFRRLREGVPWHWLSRGAWLFCFAFGMGLASIWFRYKPMADLLVGLATSALLVSTTQRAFAGQQVGVLALLQARPLVALGHFSYSLYLTHLPLLALGYFALRPLALSGPVLALVLLVAGAAASIVVAYGFHVAVERPFIRRR
jgi:peptidoglycan/LPS O-acetylase OafA/YrhL